MSDPGTVYLIHFERPLAHAGHYIGWASQLAARLKHHGNGSGSRLLRAVVKAGIGWRVARTWTGDRNLERRLKRWKKAKLLCPVCAKADGRAPSVVRPGGEVVPDGECPDRPAVPGLQ